MSLVAYRKLFNREPRPVIAKALEIIDGFIEKNYSDFSLIVAAPTAYGKSECTQAIASGLVEKGVLGERLIHTLPLRAIVEDLYVKASRYINEKMKVGAQAMHFIDAQKTPFFLYSLVYTTMDSFIYNLFKLPVAEFGKITPFRSSAHYDIPRYSIYSSFVVFDEAHLFSTEEPFSQNELISKESRMLGAFYASIDGLSAAKVPLTIMTATLPNPFTEEILQNLRGQIFWIECDSDSTEEVKFDERTIRIKVKDEEYIRDAAGLNPEFKSIIKEEMVVDTILKHVRNGLRVLVVRNTVPKAINTYMSIKEHCRCFLIHSGLTVRDRKNALKRIREGGRGECTVATQAIEAGVDVSWDVLVTDATTPMSLIQRIGRLRRELKGDEKPIFYVVEGNGDGVYHPGLVRETLDLLKKEGGKIGWRLPSEKGRLYVDGQEFISYKAVIQQVYDNFLFQADEELKKTLIEIDTYAEIDSRMVSELRRRRYCNFVREEGLITLVYPYDDLKEGLQDGFIPVSLKKLLKEDAWKRVLDVKDETINVMVEGQEGLYVESSKEVYDLFKRYKEECFVITQLERLISQLRQHGKSAIGLCLRKGTYEESVGIKFE
jgi:CRISPR-associated endonuclease/helicase Cas3